MQRALFINNRYRMIDHHRVDSDGWKCPVCGEGRVHDGERKKRGIHTPAFTCSRCRRVFGLVQILDSPPSRTIEATVADA